MAWYLGKTSSLLFALFAPVVCWYIWRRRRGSYLSAIFERSFTPNHHSATTSSIFSYQSNTQSFPSCFTALQQLHELPFVAPTSYFQSLAPPFLIPLESRPSLFDVV
ncbi:hypothetical protein QBC45DRAFT_122283 [Copromyces sp. CBS 386.78]|nr:hypothetical protein QBC45DRAFT_122283 [Copromyces sp. CBS 386.78]